MINAGLGAAVRTAGETRAAFGVLGFFSGLSGMFGPEDGNVLIRIRFDISIASGGDKLISARFTINIWAQTVS